MTSHILLAITIIIIDAQFLVLHACMAKHISYIASVIDAHACIYVYLLH